MYEYSDDQIPLGVALPKHIVDVPDNLPVIAPYVPRICSNVGHMLIWVGIQATDPDLYHAAMLGKVEPQWITSYDSSHIEKGIALVYPYENEVVLGAVKTPGYLQEIRGNRGVSIQIRLMWRDIIRLFGDRRIICPTGTFFDWVHLSMNQKRIPRSAYHKTIMIDNKFVKHGTFWIRERNNAH